MAKDRTFKGGLQLNLRGIGVELRMKERRIEEGPGGYSAYERGGDARRKFRIKPLKETDLGVAQGFFDP